MSYLDTFDLVPVYGYTGKLKGIIYGLKWKIDYLKIVGKRITKQDLFESIDRIEKTVKSLEKFMDDVQDKKSYTIGIHGGLVKSKSLKKTRKV